MKPARALLVVLVVLVAASFAVAEDGTQPVPSGKPDAAQIMKDAAHYISTMEGKKANIAGMGGNIAIRIEGGGDGGWMARALESMSQPDRMALWISDTVVMYPMPNRGGGTFIMVAGGEQAEDEAAAKIHLPDGKQAEAIVLGKLDKLGVAFATVSVPEGFVPKRLDFSTTTITLGQKVYIVGRREGEWKFAPFFIEATVNGELPSGNMTYYSLNIPQQQLENECLGAVAFDENGKFLGIVSDLVGKKFSLVLAKPDHFKDGIATALEHPDNLEPIEQPRMEQPGMPDILIPGPPVPEENPEPKAFLGISVAPLTEEKAKELGLGEAMGLLVEKVGEGSPAAQAGLQVNDVLLEAGGLILDAPDQLRALIDKHKPGDTMEFIIFREGKQMTLTVTLGGAK